jgi:hypothetical protein
VLGLLSLLEHTIGAQVAEVAFAAILTTTWLPEPSTRLARTSVMICKPLASILWKSLESRWWPCRDHGFLVF